MNDDFKEELKDAYARIEQLEAALRDSVTETLDYLGQVGQLSEELERLRAEVQTWVNHTKTAVWSDSEECKMLTEDNERLRAALREISLMDKQYEHDLFSATCVARAALEGK